MMPRTWTIKEILQITSEYLMRKGIDTPRLDAEVLLACLLNVDRVGLYVHFDQPLTARETDLYRRLIRRRARREPVQYITGKQEFWSLEFRVGPQVLIPRPETELLVQRALDRLKEAAPCGSPSLTILDLGTGSGAIAVSLAKELPHARLWATDLSSDALELARENAARHDVSGRVTFLQGDLWDPLRGKDLAFDVILSNPPYVATAEYAALPAEIRDHEPPLALKAGEEGMTIIERIIGAAEEYLCAGGWLLMEMAPHQTEKALALLTRVQGFEEIMRSKDYARSYRVVEARKKASSVGNRTE
jgi:release factor glutamine methyltransferase